MALSNPKDCRDHAEDWNNYFYHRRGNEILDLITPEILEEHRTNADQSRGMHSNDLHLVLNFFRSAPIIGKKFVYTVTPHSEYRVAIVSGRGTPVAFADDVTYGSESEAVHAVFLARVDDLEQAVATDEGVNAL